MKTEPQQHGRGNSTFVRTRNQNQDIPLSASKIKKRIRDVKRTLSKGGKHVSAQVFTESKRRLRVLEFELGEKIIDEVERANATKYHKVKHFERKKAERKIKQARNALREENDETKKAALQQKLDEAELKLLYVSHFPKTLSYVSLFPAENENDKKSHARREAILKDIKASLLAGDKDLQLMNKRYRNEYKQKLIERGDMQPDAPVDEESDLVTEEKKLKMEEESSDDSSDEKDDFFEKAK
ncbi:hypothetical protein INT47_001603 [Mucor saturninus]|uniref:rRNA-processing protein EFG1 n=1 Tax=Mucor saturninus TaxID=64648 RepID=A0A8H7VF63_9FUNG|nr:hypothetical protein INT47_001603 [Mucor saturninus]